MNRKTLASLFCLLMVNLPVYAGGAAWELVPEKSEIGFTVTQMGVGVSGHFRRFTADVILDAAKPESGHAEIVVDIASLTTGEPDADKEAMAKPWLDAKGFPQARFESNRMRALGEARYEVTGELEIKGKAREISVPLTIEQKPGDSLAVSGEFPIQRTDFGIGGGEWDEGDLVANEVPVRFRLVLAPSQP